MRSGARPNPLDLTGAVRAMVRQVDTRLAIHDLKTEAVHVDQAISREITLARLGTMLALLALVIACVGVYGTVAFTVERRTNEIGIRMALGAPARRILRMVMGDVLILAGAGTLVGLGLSFAGSRYIKSLLYGLQPTDPPPSSLRWWCWWCAVCSPLLRPPRRASKIDPMKARATGVALGERGGSGGTRKTDGPRKSGGA